MVDQAGSKTPKAVPGHFIILGDQFRLEHNCCDKNTMTGFEMIRHPRSLSPWPTLRRELLGLAILNAQALKTSLS